jgi:hypothetical protein
VSLLSIAVWLSWAKQFDWIWCNCWLAPAGRRHRLELTQDGNSLTATRAAPHHLSPSHTQCNLHVRRRHSGRCQPVQGPWYLWHRFLVQVFQGGSVLPCVSLPCVAVAVALPSPSLLHDNSVALRCVVSWHGKEVEAGSERSCLPTAVRTRQHVCYASTDYHPRTALLLVNGSQCMHTRAQAALSSLPPHVFAVADRAYSTLIRTHKSQVSVVTHARLLWSHRCAPALRGDWRAVLEPHTLLKHAQWPPH